MRISVDAHAIGCHLTGNEVYIRNLLHEFARLDEDNDLIAYISKQGVEEILPGRIRCDFEWRGPRQPVRRRREIQIGL